MGIGGGFACLSDYLAAERLWVAVAGREVYEYYLRHVGEVVGGEHLAQVFDGHVAFKGAVLEGSGYKSGGDIGVEQGQRVVALYHQTCEVGYAVAQVVGVGGKQEATDVLVVDDIGKRLGGIVFGRDRSDTETTNADRAQRNEDGGLS